MIDQPFGARPVALSALAVCALLVWIACASESKEERSRVAYYEQVAELIDARESSIRAPLDLPPDASSNDGKLALTENTASAYASLGEQLLTLSPPPDLESPNTDLASAATAYSSSLRDWADAAVASLAGDPAGDDDALGNAVKEWLGEYGIACATLAARATGDSITADLGCPEFVSVLDLLCIDETGESCGEPTVVTVAPGLYATIEQLCRALRMVWKPSAATYWRSASPEARHHSL